MLVCLVFGELRTANVALQPGKQGGALAARGRHAGTGVYRALRADTENFKGPRGCRGIPSSHSSVG